MGDYGLQARHGRDIVIIIIVFAIIATSSVILRVQSRRMLDIKLALDDYLIVVALIFVLGNAILVITTVTNGGVGLHAMSEVPFVDIQYTLKAIIPMQALYAVALGLIKTSMMVLYWRLFGSKSSLRIAVCIVGAIVWGWALSIVLEAFLLCTPFEFNWNPTLPGGKCADRNAAFVAAGVLNMATDFMVLSLPITYIWKLQLRTGQKIGLILVFGLGLFISAVSMVRVVSLMRVDFDDVTYSLPMPLMWSILEEELAITTANLPLLRHVFAPILPRGWLGSSERNNKYDSPSQNQNDYSRRRNRQENYNLTPVNLGINKSEISSSPRRKNSTIDITIGTGDDSDTELAPHGAPLDGIHVQREFEVGSAT